jgi:ornithine carbamoyltransferase
MRFLRYYRIDMQETQGDRRMAGTAAALVPTAVRRAQPARHLLSVADLDAATIAALVEDAVALKHAPTTAALRGPLAGRAVALLFQKPSLRTRVSFEVGLVRLGATPITLSGAEVGLGSRESTEDMARTLERYVDGIVARVNDHRELVRLASAASVPVVNALSDHEHPCQALADLVTLREHLGGLPARVLAFVGDGNNVAHSLLLAGASVGLHVRVATPVGYEPDPEIVAEAAVLAAASGGSVAVARDPHAVVRGADAVYTDVWASMGQEAEAAERRRVFAPGAPARRSRPR